LPSEITLEGDNRLLCYEGGALEIAAHYFLDYFFAVVAVS